MVAEIEESWKSSEQITVLKEGLWWAHLHLGAKVFYEEPLSASHLSVY